MQIIKKYFKAIKLTKIKVLYVYQYQILMRRQTKRYSHKTCGYISWYDHFGDI